MTPECVEHATSLRTSELDYELPERLIATQPMEPRDCARMLVISRSNETIEHAQVRDLPHFLRGGDALVFNTTAVAPARLVGRRISTGGKVEGLFLHELPQSDGMRRWQVMLHAGGRLKVGDRIELTSHEANRSGGAIELLHKDGDQWTVRVLDDPATADLLDAVGLTPVPPYILRARGEQCIADELDRRWYQTMYADPRKRRSVAAPTAGLHFTPELLNRLSLEGVERIDVTLHVGPGTFKPVVAETLADHRMHSEEFEASAVAIGSMHRVRAAGGRIVSVGTTSVRTLESLPWNELDFVEEGLRGSTDLLISPPYQFKCVDGMMTNFHLPRSTLLALVAAMVGLDRIKAVYRIAIEKGYRFYSYGDAMLILP